MKTSAMCDFSQVIMKILLFRAISLIHFLLC